MKNKASPLGQAISVVGSQSELARKTGLSQQYISRLLNEKGGRIPAEYVVAVSDATGIPRQKLRPDLFEEGANQ